MWYDVRLSFSTQTKRQTAGLNSLINWGLQSFNSDENISYGMTQFIKNIVAICVKLIWAKEIVHDDLEDLPVIMTTCGLFCLHPR